MGAFSGALDKLGRAVEGVERAYGELAAPAGGPSSAPSTGSTSCAGAGPHRRAADAAAPPRRPVRRRGHRRRPERRRAAPVRQTRVGGRGSCARRVARWPGPSTSRRRSTTSTTCPTSATPTRRSPPTRWPAGTACSATTSSSSPAPTSTASRSQRAAEAQRRVAPGVGRPHRASASGRRGSCSTSPTTTSSAPPSPATTVAVQAFLQRVYDNGHIELGTYEGLYCVSCEAYYTEARPGRRQLPDPRPAGRAAAGGELLLQALPLRSSRLLDWYEANPDAVQPEGKRNEALGFIRRACRTSRSPARRSTGACRCRGTTATSSTSGTTRSSTTPPPSATAPTPSASTAWWPAVHHLIGKDILRFHCVYWPAMLLAAGIEPPAHVYVHGFLLVGGEKMSKTAAQPDRPGRPGRRLRRRRLPLPLPPRHSRSAPTATSPTRAWSPATTPTSPTTSATCCPGSPPSSARSAAASVPRRRPTARSPRSRPRSYAATADGVGRASRPSMALEATWRLIREANAHLEANEPWKAEPGPEVDAVLGDALEVLRIVAILASPGHARRRRRGLAPHRPRRLAADAAPARRGGVGRLPRRPAGREGRAALPPHQAAAEPSVWTDNHCHLPRRRGRRRRRRRGRGARRAGVEPAGRRSAPTCATSHAAVAIAGAPTTACGPPPACTPTTPRDGVDGLERAARRARGRGRGGVRARLPLRPLAPRRAARRLRRPDRRWPTTATWPS